MLVAMFYWNLVVTSSLIFTCGSLSNPYVFGFVNDTERIPDYPHPVGTQTDFRIKMAYWPGIPLYEPHYIPMLRGRYHPAYVPDKRGKLAWFCHNYMKQPLNPPRYYTYNNDWVKFNGALTFISSCIYLFYFI